MKTSVKTSSVIEFETIQELENQLKFNMRLVDSRIDISNVEFIFPKNFGDFSTVSEQIDLLRGKILDSMKISDYDHRDDANPPAIAKIIRNLCEDGYQIDSIVDTIKCNSLMNTRPEIEQFVKFFSVFGI